MGERKVDRKEHKTTRNQITEWQVSLFINNNTEYKLTPQSKDTNWPNGLKQTNKKTQDLTLCFLQDIHFTHEGTKTENKGTERHSMQMETKKEE